MSDMEVQKLVDLILYWNSPQARIDHGRYLPYPDEYFKAQRDLAAEYGRRHGWERLRPTKHSNYVQRRSRLGCFLDHVYIYKHADWPVILASGSRV